VGLLDAIVQPSSGANVDVLDCIQRWNPLLGYGMACEFVGHNPLRRVARMIEQSTEESPGIGILALLDEDVEKLAMLIHRSPQVHPPAPHAQEDLVQVPRLPGSCLLAPQIPGKESAELDCPAAHHLVGDYDPALGQKFLNIPMA
jgi:hypothetical protein